MSTLHPKRRLNPDHLGRVRALPCIVCEMTGEQQTSPTEAHHIKRDESGQFYRSQKAHDDETIPLCHYHHWNGVGSGYTHRGFEAEFGNERDLLARTLATLGITKGEAA